MADAYLQLSDTDDLGVFQARARPPTVRGRLRLTDDFGDFAVVASTPIVAYYDEGPSFFIGTFKATALNLGDQWAAAGLPAPHLDSYQYEGGPDLIRTTMETGIVRQRRRWVEQYRKATVSFTIDATLLGTVEQFLDETGYDWFNMGLVTGDHDSETASSHSVRVIANPDFSEVYGNTMKLSLQLEVRRL